MKEILQASNVEKAVDSHYMDGTVFDAFHPAVWQAMYVVPRVLSSAGKLIRSDIYTGPTSWFIIPQTVSSFVFYLTSLSFCHLARLFTEGSFLHIMSRHDPYC